jgi:hypothetical protein
MAKASQGGGITVLEFRDPRREGIEPSVAGR